MAYPKTKLALLALLALLAPLPVLGATQDRDPGSDTASNGGWGPSDCTSPNFFSCVDDYPDGQSSTTDKLVAASGTPPVRQAFGITAFSITSASVTSITNNYYMDKVGGASASGGSCLYIDSTYYCQEHEPVNGTMTLTTDTWTTNPCTTAAWTEAEVEGTAGSCNLQGIGLSANDVAPDVEFASLRATVTYTTVFAGNVVRVLD